MTYIVYAVWNWLQLTLTSPSEKHSGLHTIQVLGVWSASPEDKSSDKRSCKAENKGKTIPDTFKQWTYLPGVDAVILSKKDPSLCNALTSIMGEVNSQANLVFWLTTWHALLDCSRFVTSSHKKGQTLSKLICSVKMNGYWSQYFLDLYGPRWIWGHKNTKHNNNDNDNNLAITEQS